MIFLVNEVSQSIAQGTVAWQHSSTNAQWVDGRNHSVIDYDWLFAYFFVKKKVG